MGEQQSKKRHLNSIIILYCMRITARLITIFLFLVVGLSIFGCASQSSKSGVSGAINNVSSNISSSATPPQLSHKELRIQECENKSGYNKDKCYYFIVNDNDYSSQDEGYSYCDKINAQDLADPCNVLVTHRP
jgi:hypothetical protein